MNVCGHYLTSYLTGTDQNAIARLQPGQYVELFDKSNEPLLMLLPCICIAKESQDLVLFPEESKTLHALVRQLLRLDSMSHILAWSKTNPMPSKVSYLSILVSYV